MAKRASGFRRKPYVIVGSGRSGKDSDIDFNSVVVDALASDLELMKELDEKY